MKKLLVVGDSFMQRDPNFPGQHWSEMLPEYEIILYSEPGSTNGMIAWKFFQGLKLKPDAVVLGFTWNNRLEFKMDKPGQNGRIWMSNGHTELTKEQELAVDYFSVTVDEEMNLFKNCVMALGLFYTCHAMGIPYAFTLNGLYNDLSGGLTDPKKPYPHPIVKDTLSPVIHRMCPTNLATYEEFKAVPGFHTDDPEWQQRFAQEVREILEQPLTLANK